MQAARFADFDVEQHSLQSCQKADGKVQDAMSCLDRSEDMKVMQTNSGLLLRINRQVNNVSANGRTSSLSVSKG